MRNLLKEERLVLKKKYLSEGYDGDGAWKKVDRVVEHISNFNDKLREKKKRLLENHKNKPKGALIKIESEIDKENQERWDKEFEKLWQDT